KPDMIKAAGKLKPQLLVKLSTLALLSLGGRTAVAQTVFCPQPLLFGDIITCATGNTVVLTPGNTRTVNGCLTGGGAPFSSARCIVTQGAPQPLQFSVAAQTYTLNAGPNTLTINNFDVFATGNGRVFATSSAFILTIPI